MSSERPDFVRVGLRRRGNSLYGPFGPALGTAHATLTSVEEMERMAEACHGVWFSGVRNEEMTVEAV